jgi:hypothetical protein
MAKHDLKGHQTTRGRDAGNGQFMPVERARQNPKTSTVERVPDPGFGRESSSPRGRDAGNGQFMPVREAEHRRDAVVERVPNRGPSKT